MAAEEGSPKITMDDEDVVAMVGSAGVDDKEMENGDKLVTSATLKHARDDENIPYWKTSLCSYFRSNSSKCNHGDNCRYAHGEEELRPRPDNTWDPTSERVKKVAKIECDDSDQPLGNLGLSDQTEKCLIGIPVNWHTDKLKDFLDQHVSCLLY